MRTGTRGRRRRRASAWPVALLICIALFCAAGAALRLRQSAKAEADIELLRGWTAGEPEIVYVRLAEASGEAGAPAGPAATPESGNGAAAERIRALQAENGELVGWLYMEAAGVDYPVMQSPARENFYLAHDFSGEPSKAGLPYIDEDCDAQAGAHLIIYGHNMKNGSMFGSLKRYLDAEFFAENGLFRFDTAEGSATYRVIAAYETEIDDSAAFRFYTYTDICTEDDYRSYVANVMARSAHVAGEPPVYGQRLLTLVTCVRFRPNDRLLIVAAETG